MGILEGVGGYLYNVIEGLQLFPLLSVIYKVKVKNEDMIGSSHKNFPA